MKKIKKRAYNLIRIYLSMIFMLTILYLLNFEALFLLTLLSHIIFTIIIIGYGIYKGVSSIINLIKKKQRMKQVYKCDFCSHTQEKIEGMSEHETKCSFNPINKKCFTCKHSWDSGYEYSIPECSKKLSTLTGRDDGNCTGWDQEK